EHVNSKRRPFVRYDLRVAGLNEPHAIYSPCADYCRLERAHYQAIDAEPVVQVQLNGKMSFDAGSLDTARMEEMVRDHFRALHVRVDNHTSDQDYVPDDGDID